jgi:hypothetical protein
MYRLKTAILLGIVLTSITSTAADLSTDSANLVVHEWGTFTCFSASDGVPLPFVPVSRDLPRFVYRNEIDNDSGWGKGAYAVSLETPVVYFYTKQEMNVSLEVRFRGGEISAYYPNATGKVNSTIAWKEFKIVPEGITDFPKDRNPSPYYAARATAAAPVKVSTAGKAEVEKFLFYRGVGYPNLPLAFRVQKDGKFLVRNTGLHPINSIFLVQIKKQTVKFTRIDHALKPNTEFATVAPAETSTLARLRDAMVASLIAEGLYDKEAEAMVETWSSQWFGEDGTRALYLLPSKLSEELLPLKMTPTPKELVRVLVGRHDILTPSCEQMVKSIVKQIKAGTQDDNALEYLGRFAHAARQHAERELARD